MTGASKTRSLLSGGQIQVPDLAHFVTKERQTGIGKGQKQRPLRSTTIVVKVASGGVTICGVCPGAKNYVCLLVNLALHGLPGDMGCWKDHLCW